jgi:hypothetical protein
MDPYLENPAHWRGVHAALIVAIYEELNASLPEGFLARIEERVYLTLSEERIYPDVSVERTAPESGGGVATLAPSKVDVAIRVPIALEETRERFVEVVTLDIPEKVVAAIEVLSPSNKTPGDGYEEYRRKQIRYLRSTTHLLEIDLLRAGKHTVAASEEALKKEVGRWDYVVSLHRAGSGDICETWPRTLRDPLPEVPVPLTEGFPDAPLPLQKILTHVWEAGPFRRAIDYALPPVPPLRAEDATWAGECLHEAIKR